MIWPPEVLAYQLLAAGFDAADAAVGVAVAITATGGDDAYVWAATSIGDAPLVGAWAIPNYGADEIEGLDLYRLSQNALAARRLWEASGRSWRWSAVWRAGGWSLRLTEAERAVATPARGVRAGVRYPDLETVSAAPDLLRASEQFRSTVHDAIRFAANPKF